MKGTKYLAELVDVNMLKKEKLAELASKEPDLMDYYIRLDNGFYRTDFVEKDREKVKALFEKLGFSALNFTDSRSRFQFYDLQHLWNDLNNESFIVCLYSRITILTVQTASTD